MNFNRRMAVAVTLVTLLLIAPVAAILWHHHTGSSDAACSICHFIHQPMDRPMASHRLPSFELVNFCPPPPEPAFVSSPEFRRLPSRAPPA